VDAPSGAPQNPFTLQIPVDGSTGVLTTNSQFAWGALAGAQSYQLQVSLTSDFSQIVYDQPNITLTSVFIQAGFTSSSTYYWRVYGFATGSQQLAGGSPYRFTTLPPPFAPPGQFFLQSPTGGPIAKSPPPVLLWTVSAGAVRYQLEIDTSSTFSNPVVDLATIHYNSVTCPIPLLASTTYYWRVIAFNSSGQTASSPLFQSFTTGP
jgi:hypothetical protein